MHDTTAQGNTLSLLLATNASQKQQTLVVLNTLTTRHTLQVTFGCAEASKVQPCATYQIQRPDLHKSTGHPPAELPRCAFNECCRRQEKQARAHTSGASQSAVSAPRSQPAICCMARDTAHSEGSDRFGRTASALLANVHSDPESCFHHQHSTRTTCAHLRNQQRH